MLRFPNQRVVKAFCSPLRNPPHNPLCSPVRNPPHNPLCSPVRNPLHNLLRNPHTRYVHIEHAPISGLPSYATIARRSLRGLIH